VVEHVANDQFRPVSLKNALSLLIHAIKAGLFEYETDMSNDVVGSDLKNTTQGKSKVPVYELNKKTIGGEIPENGGIYKYFDRRIDIKEDLWDERYRDATNEIFFIGTFYSKTIF